MNHLSMPFVTGTSWVDSLGTQRRGWQDYEAQSSGSLIAPIFTVVNHGCQKTVEDFRFAVAVRRD